LSEGVGLISGMASSFNCSIFINAVVLGCTSGGLHKNKKELFRFFERLQSLSQSHFLRTVKQRRFSLQLQYSTCLISELLQPISKCRPGTRENMPELFFFSLNITHDCKISMNL
jgi:hypothetical protein